VSRKTRRLGKGKMSELVKVWFYADLENVKQSEIDTRVNKLLDRLGEVDTSDLALSWDNANWEIID
jgi:hypothetical protein